MSNGELSGYRLIYVYILYREERKRGEGRERKEGDIYI